MTGGAEGARERDPPGGGAGREPAARVFTAFLALGLTSFGGPVAHIGYFRDAFVTRRRWIEERAYADLVALCQMLPGPTSSQVGIGIGLARAGLPGAAAAWVGFTLPSALLMVAFGYGVAAYEEAIPAGALQGLKVVAAAVVAQALWGMARTLCPDAPRATVAVLAGIAALLAPSVVTHVAIIAAGALIGLLFLRPAEDSARAALGIAVDRRLAVLLLVLFAALLGGLPIFAAAWPAEALALADGFYRAASLVFGGGHVLLPLLQAEVVPPGWVGRETFIAGYGAAQAVPGPLFTFAAYLGAVAGIGPGGALGGLLCLAAVFLPSFLLVVGALPFWEALRRLAHAERAMRGVNAAVVGLLGAAFYDPIWTGGIETPADLALGLAAFALLAFWKVPPWAVVVMGALAGWGSDALAG